MKVIQGNPKAKKPINKTTLKSEALTLWSLCVRKINPRCQMCGSIDRLQAHHIRSVRRISTMLDLDNGMTLCFPCHSLQHFNPELFHDRVIDVIGIDAYQLLRDRSSIILKLHANDYRDRINSLKKELSGEAGILPSDGIKRRIGAGERPVCSPAPGDNDDSSIPK